jgi:hypothetical protein
MKTAIGPIVALLLVVGCGAPSPSPSDAATVGIDPLACALATQPGPQDRPRDAGGDLMDLTNAGPGRWRVCTIEPTAVVAEGTAWCRWNDGRTGVDEVQGLPVPVGGGTVDGGVALRQAATYLSTTSTDGTINSYDSTSGPQAVNEVNAVDGGRSGAARFVLGPILDPEHPPAVRPTNIVGVLRWQCGAPPAPGH